MTGAIELFTAGLKTLLNTNGFINPEPLKELLQYLNAVNLDLKGFTAEFYVENCYGELEPVLKSLKLVKEGCQEAGTQLKTDKKTSAGKKRDSLAMARVQRFCTASLTGS